MDDNIISELQSRLQVTSEALCKAEERATAGQLALEMIHEIKNPLETLGHFTYLAYEEAEQPDKTRYYMKMAEEQVAHLSRIASQTLGFSRRPTDSRSTDLVVLTEAALRIHQRAIQERKIHLVKSFPEQLVGDAFTGQLLHVISNLLVNALDSMQDRDGKITMRLRRRNGQIHLLIADNGHGIHPDHIKSIFEPFFTTKGDCGTGLGLALTRKIVDRHNGKIRVRSSVHPSRSGTTFKISLPG